MKFVLSYLKRSNNACNKSNSCLYYWPFVRTWIHLHCLRTTSCILLCRRYFFFFFLWNKYVNRVHWPYFMGSHICNLYLLPFVIKSLLFAWKKNEEKNNRKINHWLLLHKKWTNFYEIPTLSSVKHCLYAYKISGLHYLPFFDIFSIQTIWYTFSF